MLTLTLVTLTLVTLTLVTLILVTLTLRPRGDVSLGGLFLGGIFPGGTFPKTTQSWPSLLFSGGITEFTVKPETVRKMGTEQAFPRQIQCISQENVFVPLKLTSQTI